MSHGSHEQLLVGDRFGFGKADDGLRFRHVFLQFPQVESFAD